MAIEDELKRKFYLEMARIEHWDTRTLDHKIDGLLYERTALSRKPEELIKQELQQIESTNSLPDKKILSKKSHKAIAIARENQKSDK
jgi:predicted nuclease of restriction endonuclease-like (RecB) superfamily